jgi:hypothetical protein
MNPNRFYQEKSALLTALAAQITSCKYTLESINRLDKMSPTGEDDEVKHLAEMAEDLLRLTENLRDAVDSRVVP